jgi:hypothetical protein
MQTLRKFNEELDLDHVFEVPKLVKSRAGIALVCALPSVYVNDATPALSATVN